MTKRTGILPGEWVMDEVEVEVGESEVRQRLFDGVHNVLPRMASVPHLGRDKQLLSGYFRVGPAAVLLEDQAELWLVHVDSGQVNVAISDLQCGAKANGAPSRLRFPCAEAVHGQGVARLHRDILVGFHHLTSCGNEGMLLFVGPLSTRLCLLHRPISSVALQIGSAVSASVLVSAQALWDM
jgi:hypothetical protein